MKRTLLIKLCLSSIILIGITNCKDNKTTRNEKEVEIEKVVSSDAISVYNFSNQSQLQEFNKLKLDETHPNLLNPRISESKYQEVLGTWTDLHQKIGDILDEKKFSWGVQDSVISIVHKFYFEPNGQIKSYFFNVLNPSISESKKEEFAVIVSDFAQNNAIDLTRESSFAQCGKTKYMNN